MVCQNCHYNGIKDAKFCSGCGQPFAQMPYAPVQSRLNRPRYGRVIAGVCAGFAQEYGMDPILLRLAVCALVFFGCGMPVLLYIVAWIVMPNGPQYYCAPMPPVPPAPPSEPTVVA